MQKILSQLLNDRRKIFAILCIISLVAFFPTRHAGLIYDFIGWQQSYDAGGWSDVINCFGYPGLHQVLHFVFFGLYQILHTYAVGWYVVFALSHAAVAYLVYVWIKKLASVLGARMFDGAALVIALFTLIHPHSVEVVVWKVCIHYILSTIWILTIMIQYLNYINNGQNRHLYWAYLCFFLSFFTLEISYVTPVLMLLMVIVVAAMKKDWKVFWDGTKKAVGPLFLILGLLLCLNRLVLGAWVGHYGADVHLDINLIGMASNEAKYFIKHFSLLRFADFHTKNAIFDSLSNTVFAFHALLIIVFLIGLWFVKLGKWTKKVHLTFFGLFGFMIYIFPIANLFFYHLMLGSNDRFGYVPAMFMGLFFVSLVSILPKKIRWFIIIPWLVLNLYFQQKIAHLWKHSNTAFTELTNDFRWYDRDKVIVLNLPDNYNGILVFSTIEVRSGLEEALEYNRGKKYEGTIYDVYMYNMMDLSEGVVVSQTGPRKLKVEFSQWGNWWFHKGIGASDYENEYYKVINQGHHFDFIIKDPALDATFIYQDGTELKEFIFDPNWSN